MSQYIPENMEEVAMQVAKRQVHGEQVTADEVIKQATFDILQALLDEALEGRYDEVHWSNDGEKLVITGPMGDKIGEVEPNGKSFVEEFKADSDALMDHFVRETARLVNGR
ncbi:hypothetical protein AALA17_00545 [Lactobacillaceae bacterium 24-114]